MPNANSSKAAISALDSSDDLVASTEPAVVEKTVSTIVTPSVVPISSTPINGVLLKRSDWLRAWRKRYVVLDGRLLTVATESGVKPHGRIIVETVEVTKVSGIDTIAIRDKAGYGFYFP